MCGRNKHRAEHCCSMKTCTNLIGMLYGVSAFYLFILTAEHIGEIYSLNGRDDVNRFLDMMGLSRIISANIVGIKFLRVMTIVLSVIHGLSYISSAMLIIGVNNDNVQLLFLWVVYFSLLLVGYLIAMVFAVILIVALHGIITLAIIILPAIIVCLAWCLFIGVVCQHRSHLKETIHPGDVIRRNSEDCRIPTVSYLVNISPVIRATTQ